MSARLLLSELSRLGRNVDDVLANVRLCKDNHLNVYLQKEQLSIFDADGKYFPDRYFLDSYDEPLYFETIGEAAECVTDIVGHPVEATIKAIDEALDEYVEEHEDEDVFYSFHEFKKRSGRGSVNGSLLPKMFPLNWWELKSVLNRTLQLNSASNCTLH